MVYIYWMSLVIFPAISVRLTLSVISSPLVNGGVNKTLILVPTLVNCAELPAGSPCAEDNCTSYEMTFSVSVKSIDKG